MAKAAMRMANVDCATHSARIRECTECMYIGECVDCVSLWLNCWFGTTVVSGHGVSQFPVRWLVGGLV